MNSRYDYQKYVVLFVDDEENLLKYFERAFSSDFRIVTASSAAKAWDYAREHGDDAVAAVERPEGPVIRIESRRAGDRTMCSISDNGPGIPDEQLPRIFEQFYTTRAADEGTGLGLYICKTIVNSYGGNISVETSPSGSKFEFDFPAAAL